MRHLKRFLCLFGRHEYEDIHMQFRMNDGSPIFLDGTVCKWCREIEP